jgi:hypothetical protein
MRLDELIKVIDVLTVVEIVKNGDRTIYKGTLKDIKDMQELRVYRISPNSSSRQLYLEIDVY